MRDVGSRCGERGVGRINGIGCIRMAGTDKISMQLYCFATRHEEERGRRANDHIPTCLSLDRVHPAGGPYLSNRKPKIRGMRSLCVGKHIGRVSRGEQRAS